MFSDGAVAQLGQHAKERAVVAAIECGASEEEAEAEGVAAGAAAEEARRAQTSMPADMGPFSVLLCLWYLKFASPDERSGTSPVMQPCSRQHAGTSAHLYRGRVG